MRGTKPITVYTQDTSSANITTSFTEVSAALAADVNQIIVAASAAMQVILGIGASGSEANLIAFTASTVSAPPIPILIPRGARISVKSVTGTISSGVLGITFLN